MLKDEENDVYRCTPGKTPHDPRTLALNYSDCVAPSRTEQVVTSRRTDRISRFFGSFKPYDSTNYSSFSHLETLMGVLM